MHTENWVGNSLMFYIIVNASAAFETIIWSLGGFGLHPLPIIEQDERMNDMNEVSDYVRASSPGICFNPVKGYWT